MHRLLPAALLCLFVSAPAGAADPALRLGLVQGACLAIDAEGLARGTALTTVLPTQGLPVVAHVQVAAGATDAESCAMQMEGRSVEIGGEPASFYRLSSGTPKPTDLAFAVIGIAEAGAAAGNIVLHAEGRSFVLTSCATSEGLQFAAWSGAPYASKASWRAYYGLGYDLDPNCPQTDQ